MSRGRSSGRADRDAPTRSAVDGRLLTEDDVEAGEHAFAFAVHRVIRSIPTGEVMTYGEVALEAGSPGAARAVGNVLAHSTEYDLPWWRVVRSGGYLATGKEARQAERLRAEGIPLNDAGIRVVLPR